MLCSYSKINMGDSCLKFKKGDSKLFRPNSTHEEKSAIQESLYISHIGGRVWMYLHYSSYHPTWRRNQAKMNFKLR